MNRGKIWKIKGWKLGGGKKIRKRKLGEIGRRKVGEAREMIINEIEYGRGSVNKGCEGREKYWVKMGGGGEWRRKV